ncbi:MULTISPECIES: DUF948 domain-containing protein [unclassified Granulicatella]|uniref:DUF948 domain-containing protein n=1 Tax=unclassified Granulicatella TaxID=2630493 RepID=UPI0010734846|nr:MULTISPECIES: DUF948 domain-containing protein [unclassified Granulicatella]MBF0780200.1 DUF948 domain-containing protein [Granulicatella sp. 19428wC4_WM01]TFU95693.1 DUF948 domain-containing protein [Granulicatella sp. WM01]
MNLNDILITLLLIVCIVLIVVAVFMVKKLIEVLKTSDNLLKEVTNTVTLLTKDVDSLAIEVEGLLNKSNHLLNDLNGKLEKTDPAFSAIGELGISVSNVNTSAKNLSKSFIVKKNNMNNTIAKTGSSMGRIFKSLTKKKTKIKKY